MKCKPNQYHHLGITLLVQLVVLSISLSCTRIQHLPIQERETIIFPPDGLQKNLKSTESIFIEYKSCSKVTKESLKKYFQPLISHFKKEFEVELYGLSKVKIETLKVVDTNLLVANELCRKFTGFPLTTEAISNNQNHKIVIEDNRAHVH